jgi:hypothetical protein
MHNIEESIIEGASKQKREIGSERGKNTKPPTDKHRIYYYLNKV